MLAHLPRRIAPQVLRRCLSTSKSTPGLLSGRRNAALGAAACIGALAGASLFVPTVFADILETTETPSESSKLQKYQKPPPPSSGKNDLDTFTWGSNQNHTISPGDVYDTKRPTPFARLSGAGAALRDLAFHERHAACVDSAGNLYQWGDGFFGTDDSEDGEPVLTLKDKDIIKVALSASKVYALSKTGKVYVVSAAKENQTLNPATPEPKISWWNPFWSWYSKPTVDFIELSPEVKLGHSERFTSISSGRSHLLALTSAGRTFATPITSSANSHGQLGARKVQLSSPASTSGRVAVELLPKALADPFAQSTPAIRTITSSTPPAAPLGETRNDDDIRFCDLLFEIPALKGVPIAQVAAGDRASYAMTPSGRVLGWGANEYGQLGLGSNFTLPFVPVPTEIVFSKNYPGGSSVKCLNIAAGGDVVYFTVENTKSGSSTTNVDLLAAGMGQYGSLGNNSYSQAQGAPVRVRVVSSVQEYNETLKATQPLAPKTVSASPTHHAIVVLDTCHLDGNTHEQSREQARKGRDVYSWGYNMDYQLGLGRRTSVPQPTVLPGAAFVGGFDVDDKVGRMMTRERRVDILRDLEGNKVGKNVHVEQTMVAGWGCSAMFWKIV